jgi:hypothetical protein
MWNILKAKRAFVGLGCLLFNNNLSVGKAIYITGIM